MNSNYLKTYYPDGISAEERLFTAGERCTRIPLSNWWAMVGVGFIVALVGLLISSIDYDLFGFGMFVFGLGDLAITIGVFGITRYFAGLRCLERAELLYNTRLAAGENEIIEPAKNAGHTASSPIRQAPQATGHAVLSWTCTCGKTNADYMPVCSCGVTKQQAKQARPTPSANNGVRTPSTWRCTCGKEHPAYVSSCSCGVNKSGIK